ncbi:transposase [Posidoniimonas corsicana]|uniref:transposase n=1 Tax=Posidoniimonas corsicana TaxID=1938618 RepID=UPI0036F1F5F3
MVPHRPAVRTGTRAARGVGQPGRHRHAENCLAALGCSWVRFHRLPPYAPELNPVEHVWSTSKWGPLAGAPPDDLDQLHGDVEGELTRQAHSQRLPRSHFRWAGLELR